MHYTCVIPMRIHSEYVPGARCLCVAQLEDQSGTSESTCQRHDSPDESASIDLSQRRAGRNTVKDVS